MAFLKQEVRYFMFKLITLAILLISSSICLSDDVKTYDGIWQNSDNDRSYYTIQTKGQQIVLIDLSTIESTGSSLSSAYLGNTSDYNMNPILGGKIKKLEFKSPNEGVILDTQCSYIYISEQQTWVPICISSATTSPPITIRKIF